MKKRLWICIMVLALVTAMLLNLTGCVSKAKATDLMKGIRPGSVQGKEADEAFRLSQMEFALDLFRATMETGEKENLLLSPLSVQLALAMTANGAAGQTRQEMETFLSKDIPLELLNEYLYTYGKDLPNGANSKLSIANSIWYRDAEDRLQVEADFLQTNGDYYGAQIYKAPFDRQTVKDINSWVSEKTDGMIDSLVDEISKDTVLYLLNAIAFDAKWDKPYKKHEVRERTFYTESGEEIPVEMMYSTQWQYLDDSMATGFLKDYKDGSYTFAALLPKENVDIGDYVKSLTPETLLALLDNPMTGMGGQVGIPKFSFDYEISMNDTLKSLGVERAFDGAGADFSSMARSTRGNICIGDVLHKTHITVDEEGTKAAAATKVEIVEECAPVEEWSVILDRPFVFLILDRNTNLPIFVGVVLNPQG